MWQMGKQNRCYCIIYDLSVVPLFNVSPCTGVAGLKSELCGQYILPKSAVIHTVPLFGKISSADYSTPCLCTICNFDTNFYYDKDFKLFLSVLLCMTKNGGCLQMTKTGYVLSVLSNSVLMNKFKGLDQFQ